MKRVLRALRLIDRYGYASDFGLVVVAAVILVGVVGGLAYAGVGGARAQCERKVEAMGREGRHDWLAGCFVRLSDGTEVPLENYRLTNEEGSR